MCGASVIEFFLAGICASSQESLRKAARPTSLCEWVARLGQEFFIWSCSQTSTAQPMAKLELCARCGGPKRGTGAGYCPKPACRAAAKAAAPKVKAKAKPEAAAKAKVRARPAAAALPPEGAGAGGLDEISELFAGFASDAEDAPAAAEAAPPVHATPVRKRKRGKQPPTHDELMAEAEESRPTKRVPRPSLRCAGRSPDEPCIFSTQHPDAPARVSPDRPGGHLCCFCDDEHLRHLHDDRSGTLTAVLKAIQLHNPDAFEPAIAIVTRVCGEEVAEDFKKRVARARHRAERVVTTVEGQWEEALKHRVSHEAAYEEDWLEQWRGWHADDNRRRDRKFPGVFNGDVDKKDWMTDRCRALENWATHNSWFLCANCHRLETRKMAPADGMQPERKLPGTKRCKHCLRNIGYAAPQPDDVPEPLRAVPVEVLLALRVFEVDTGHPEKEIRATDGYRVHVDVIRFRMPEESVKTRIKKLPRELRRRAKEVLEYLRSQKDTNKYDDFYKMQTEFLETVGEHASKQERQLPVNFMEWVGLECACWPHLYWRTDMCESYIRSMDVRRQLRRASAHGGPEDRDRSGAAIFARAEARRAAVRKKPSSGADADSSSSDSEDDDDAAGAEGRQSLKASFLAKVLSPVLGYGTDAELSQYVYDLWMWTRLGGAKNSSGVPLRLALAGSSFSPEFWRTWHCALLDVQRQVGLPTLFLTIAPYEWGFPYHAFMEDEMAKLLRSRLWLPAAETLHLAHVLTQVLVGFVTGKNHQNVRGDRCWKDHLLGKDKVITFFGRLEFQDGKRKRVHRQAQDYHGRGTVHLHALIWLEDLAAAKPEDIITAVLPDPATPMGALVRGSQLSWSGSGRDVHEGPTHVDEDTGLLVLQHGEADHAAGVRAYMPEVLGALKSHMDVQSSDGRGLLLRYCSTYVAKFSDSFAQGWLNDEASDFAVARRVLSEYHPLEPEMWLQLASFLMRPCVAGGSLRKMAAPSPWREDQPEIVQAYMSSTWRCDDMSLLEFMRKTNKTGDIARCMRKRWEREADEDQSLHDFVNTCQTRGETMMAVRTSSRFSDSFYGEWVMLHVPFRDLADLRVADLKLVPENFRCFAMALHHAEDFWRDIEQVKANLELEAFSTMHLESNLAMVRAHAAVVDGYMSGELVLGRDAVPIRRLPAHAALPTELHDEQWRVVDSIMTNVHLALQGLEIDVEPQIMTAKRDTAPMAVLGPAGSGKSTAVQVAIQQALALEARVVVACPTRMLVADWRAKFPGLDVDSIHAVFELFKDEHHTLDAMVNFDLVVIEEVSQVDCEMFERLLRLWDAAVQRPALVFVGDFAQLRGVNPTRALDSPRWSKVRQWHLHTMRRCKCPDLKRKLELLRTAKPSVKQLADILKGHKAPSRARRQSRYMTPEPTEEDIANIFAETPETTFVTISRAAAAWVNEAAVKSIFPGAPVKVVPGDPESNPNNYRGTSQVGNAPVDLPIYIGGRLTITRNINKECDYVNGMGAVVLGVHRAGVRVRTDTGYILVIFPWTDESGTVFLPIRSGYAHTLMKVQGATLPHLTVYLDAANVEAAGYVALSRVQYDAHWQYVGDPTVHHFVPSTAV